MDYVDNVKANGIILTIKLKIYIYMKPLILIRPNTVLG